MESTKAEGHEGGERVPTFKSFTNPQAERLVLSAILENPAKAWKHVIALGVQDEWFTDRICFTAIKAIRNLMSAGKPVDVVLVAEEIRTFTTSGGIKLAEEFMLTVPNWPKAGKTNDSICQHIQILGDKNQRQNAVWYMEEATERLAANDNVGIVLGSLKHSLNQVGRSHVERTESHEDMVDGILNECLIAKDTGAHGVAVPWIPLEHLISGLPTGKVTIVAARPAQGKSTVVNALSSHNAWDKNSGTGVWSLEMTKAEWYKNMVGARYGIDCFKMKSGRYQEAEFNQFKKGLEEAKKIPLYINDRPQTIGSLCSDIREQVTERCITMVVIDYLTLLCSDRKKGSAASRQEEVAGWSNALTNLAKDCNQTAFLVVSQLKRPNDNFTPKPPQLHDLRESGAIEQDAYMVMFIYQDPQAGDMNIPDNAPTIIEIAKNRGGRTGSFSATFEKSKQRMVC